MKSKRPSNVLLGDLAYQAIRDAITSSRIKPGERISEYMMAERLQMSRTPVREGLRRLENEGLLASHARRGLVVAGLDDSGVHELYAAREVLEGTVASMAARFATDAEISELQHMVDLEVSIAQTPEKMYEHNRAFHQLVYQAARNRYLLKFLLVLSDNLSAHRSVSTMVSASRREEVLREHRALADAIAAHDEEAARAAATGHIQGALRARIAVQRAAAAASSTQA